MQLNKETVEKIKSLIQKGDTERAIKTLLNLKFSNIEKQLILLSSRFEKVNENLRLGIIEREIAQLEINKINVALIELLEKDSKQKERSLSKSKNHYFFLFLIILVIGGFILYIIKSNFEEHLILEADAKSIIEYIVNHPEIIEEKYGKNSIIIPQFKIDSIEFDLAIYRNRSKLGDLYLLKFNEPNKAIVWAEIDIFMNKSKMLLSREKVCESLLLRREVNSIVYDCPIVTQILYTNKRENLTPADLQKMKNINLNNPSNKPSKWWSLKYYILTYDSFIEEGIF